MILKTFFFSFILSLAGANALAQLQCARIFSELTVDDSNRVVVTSKDMAAATARVALHRIPNQTYSFNHPEKAFVEVMKLGGLEHAYLALFNHTTYMNLSLGRIATFQTQNRIMSDLALTKKTSQALGFAGHDLPQALFEKYLAAFPGGVSQDNSPKLDVERDFWQDVILPLRAKDPEATLIAVGLDYMEAQTISHEDLHANFYEKPELRKSVGDFWQDKVSSEDKATILNILKREKYDINNHEQVINEFMAYTLEAGPSLIFPPALKKKYRDLLVSSLAAAGFKLPALVK